MSRSTTVLAVIFGLALGCGSSVDGGGGIAGSRGKGSGGGPGTNRPPPSTSSTTSNPPPPTLQPNPNNPDDCPSTLPAVGSFCDASQSYVTCSYVGAACLEWVSCYADCVGTTVSVGAYGGSYADCNGGGVWQSSSSQTLPACNAVACELANDGDPCTVVGDACGYGDECSSTTKTCGADKRWSVTSSYDNCCYDGCGYGGYGGAGQSSTVGVSVGVGGNG